MMRRCLVLLLLSLLSVSSAWSAEWSNRVGVTPKLIFTDNTCKSNDNKQSEWIGSVRPSASISGKGAKATLNATAGVAFNTLKDDGNKCGNGTSAERVIPTLGASLTSELVDNWFYFNANASVRQNRVNEFAAGGDDGLDRTGNLNTTARYSLNPYIQRRFLSYAQLYLGYDYDDQVNSEQIVGDSTRQKIIGSLGSVPGTGEISWSINGRYDKIDYDQRTDLDATDSELSSASATLGYQVNRELQVNGTAGQEWNDFVSFNEDIDGEFWDVGFVWTPIARFTLDAGIGDRFFGEAPRFSLSYRHKRSQLVAGYSKNITYTRSIRSLGEVDSATIETGEDGSLTVDTPVDAFGQPTTLTRSPVLDERFFLVYRLQGRVTSVSLTGNYSNQTRERDGGDSEFTSVVLNASRLIATDYRVNGGISWSKRLPIQESTELVNDSETWRFRLGLSKKLGVRTNLSLNYLFTKRDSDIAQNTYEENRITLSLRFTL